MDPSPILGWVLGYGARLSVLILVVGLAVTLFQGETGGAGIRPDVMLQALTRGKGLGILGLGIAVLIVTPVLRETAALVLFNRSRERAYTVLSVIVLALIALSVLIGSR
jgi:uncharacterized membrane protein